MGTEVRGNEMKISKLMVNSTYDSSIYIYTSKGVNITLVDGMIEVVTPPDKEVLENFQVKVEDELKMKVQKLLNDSIKLIENESEILPVKEAFWETMRLMEQARTLQLEPLDEESRETILRLIENLEIFHESLTQRQDEERLTELVGIIEETLNSTEWNEEKIKSVEHIIELTVDLIPKVRNLNLARAAHFNVQEIQKAIESFHNRKVLMAIASSIRSNFFTAANATILNAHIEWLNNMQPANRNFQVAVNLLKQEIGNLTEAINVIDTTRSVLAVNAEQFVNVLSSVPHLKSLLGEIESASKNEHFRIKAGEMAELLHHKQKQLASQSNTGETENVLRVLDAINQTLADANGFGGTASLVLMEKKLNDILDTASDENTLEKAVTLMKLVKALKLEIALAIELVDRVERKIRVPLDDHEVDQYQQSIEVFNNIVRLVKDPEVTRRATQVIKKMESFIDEYKSRAQVESFYGILQKMNQSLEGAQSESQIKKDEKALNLLEKAVKEKEPNMKADMREILSSISIMKRKIPTKSHKLELRREANELRNIVNGFLCNVLPEMEEEIRDVVYDFEALKKQNQSVLQTEGLTERLQIVRNDYKRINNSLNVIKEKLHGFTTDDVTTPTQITKNITAKLLQLNKLIDDKHTHEIVRLAFATIQGVEHANESLKQLRRMAKSHMQLTKTSKASEKPIKSFIVPVKRVSLLKPTEPGKTEAEKPATNASDLDKSADKNSSKPHGDGKAGSDDEWDEWKNGKQLSGAFLISLTTEVDCEILLENFMSGRK